MKTKLIIISLIFMFFNVSYSNEIINLKKFATRGKSPVFQISIFDDSTAILNGTANIEYIGEYKANIKKHYADLILMLDKINIDTLQEKYNFKIMDYPVTKITFHYKGKNKTTSFKREVPAEVKKLSDFIINQIIKNSEWEKINN